MTKDLDRKVAQAMGFKSVNDCASWGAPKEKDPEDEAFDELALKQGQWHHTSGWRKKQIADAQEVDALYISGWNSALEMAAFKIEKELSKAFPADTLASFSTYIRGMKR